VVREPHRGAYDRETIYKILDEGLCVMSDLARMRSLCNSHAICPRCDTIYFHGSAASRMLRGAASGIPVCITVTLTDGLVLADLFSITL